MLVKLCSPWSNVKAIKMRPLLCDCHIPVCDYEPVTGEVVAAQTRAFFAYGVGRPSSMPQVPVFPDRYTST